MRTVLVGEKFDRSENLALEVLQAALASRGHAIAQVPMRGLTDIEETTRQVLRARPGLVGLSIGYQVSAMTALALAHQLRRSGYRGHLTAGGAFATLHFREILRDCPLDSIALFEGEGTLTALAEHLDGRGSSLEEIPGLVLRTADGVRQTAPPRVWDDPFPFRPARSGEQPEHLGVRTASMYASRGCNARCAYCCVAALRDSARAYAVDAGLPASTVPPIRRRPPAAVADEIDDLRKHRDVRLFRFEDDCLLGSSPGSALRYLTGLQAALDARRIDDVAFTFKLRPDCVTPDTTAALARLGMIHGFIGIEAMTDGTLKRIGRSCRAAQCQTALSSLADAAIPAYFNALILGPDATAPSITADLDALAGIHDFPLDIAMLLVYANTPLFERLEARGAVQGNYLCWRYEFEDPRVAVVARALSRLPTRHTGAYTIGRRLADLQLNLAIARRFHPHAPTMALARECAELTRKANASTLGLVRRLLIWAETRPGLDQQEGVWRELAGEFGTHDGVFAARIEELLAELETAATAGRRRRATAFLRSGLAAAVLGGAQLLFAGCQCGSRPITDSGSILADSASDSGAETDSGTSSDSGPEPMDSAIVDSGPGTDAGACTTPVTMNEASWLVTNAGEPCVPFICVEVFITFTTDASGVVTSVSGSVTPTEEACILAALSGVCFPNATDTTINVSLFGPCD